LLTVVAIVSGAAIVSQAQQSLLTRHVRDAVLSKQAPLVGHLPATQSMRLVLVLPHRNQAGLDDFLKEVYDPSSASYRKFLTVEEFTARFGPSQEDYDSLIQFAKANGLTVVKTSRNRMNVDVTGPVASIEKALHVTMGLYQHPTESRTFFAPDREPTTDTGMQLWAIGGLDNYSTPKPMFTRRDPNAVSPENARSNATIGSGPSASFLGSDMRAAYYVDGNASATLTGAGQSLGLFEFIGTDLTDLTTYYKNVSQTNNVPVTLKSVDTQSTLCKEPTCDDTEQTLDMTQALGMAPGMSSLVMWIGTGGLSGQTLDDAGILNGMATASPLNAQLSCSWAWTPADPTTDDVYFLEFAAQGQNFFTASGDDGSWAHAEFVWPADSVYITSVGGTDLDTSSAAAPSALKSIATARMFRPMRISASMSAPTRKLARLTSTVEPALLRPCGLATWLSPTNRRSRTERAARSASSTQRFTLFMPVRAMTLTSTTSPVEATPTGQPSATIWRPVWEVRTGTTWSMHWLLQTQLASPSRPHPKALSSLRVPRVTPRSRQLRVAVSIRPLACLLLGSRLASLFCSSLPALQEARARQPWA
jgi:kumamolisin